MSGADAGAPARPAREHWQQAWSRKRAEEVSWFQPEATCSLALIQRLAPDRASAIVDIGGGASRLADGLLDAGYRDLSVLDLSAAALAQARERLGARAASVAWIVGDITETRLPKRCQVWHDRAAFHFLTDAARRTAYVDEARRAVEPGGHLVIATFASDGPQKCSGLDVVRYDAEQLARAFGAGFVLLESEHEHHRTPAGGGQKFLYCVFQKRRDA